MCQCHMKIKQKCPWRLPNDSDNYSKVLWGHSSTSVCFPGALDQLSSPKWDHFAWPRYCDIYNMLLFVLSFTIPPTPTVLQDNLQIL